MKLSSRIYQTSHHTRLVDFLFARFTYLSKEQWSDRIEDNRILVNDRPATPDTDLKNGDVVTYEVGDIPEPEADLSYSIVYEDDWIVGVNKPGNLLVHKAGFSITRNLVFLLRHSSNNPAYAGINSVNRLDRETSGIVLFSKHGDCLRRLHKDFASGKIEKLYFALVHGAPSEKTVQVELPIGPDLESQVKYKFRVDATHGKRAVTRMERISAGPNHSLLVVRPLTGRTHQIRVHLAAIGCAVVGDKLYGMSEEKYLAWRSDPARFAPLCECARQALHCGEISFAHPQTGVRTTIRAPLPEDMRLLMEKLQVAGRSYFSGCS
jgi:RluA family pseudouridine synthase